ncbi:MAG TPA: hypothetical protein VFE14_04435 [Micromonosporaceae bacterium]|nr:hypothetical protein [Micromonosporaceae bacterium]
MTPAYARPAPATPTPAATEPASPPPAPQSAPPRATSTPAAGAAGTANRHTRSVSRRPAVTPGLPEAAAVNGALDPLEAAEAEPENAAPPVPPRSLGPPVSEPGSQADPPLDGQQAIAPALSLESDFSRSLVYSGGLALAIAFLGLVMISWRRRQW